MKRVSPSKMKSHKFYIVKIFLKSNRKKEEGIAFVTCSRYNREMYDVVCIDLFNQGNSYVRNMTFEEIKKWSSNHSVRNKEIYEYNNQRSFFMALANYSKDEK